MPEFLKYLVAEKLKKSAELPEKYIELKTFCDFNFSLISNDQRYWKR